jgi:hypothetical protein
VWSKRQSLASAALASLPLTLTGCGTAPITTSVDGQYANGVSKTVGDIAARDLLVVGDRDQTGLLSGALVNQGAEPTVVLIQLAGQAKPVQVRVAAGELVTLGSNGGPQITIAKMTAPAGGQLPIGLATGTGGQVEVAVPVVARDGEYATVTPTATPTMTPTVTTPPSLEPTAAKN